MTKLFVRLMLPAQFGMQFALRILAQSPQLIFEKNSRYIHEPFSLWPQERTVNIVEATDMELSVPRVEIIYLKMSEYIIYAKKSHAM